MTTKKKKKDSWKERRRRATLKHQKALEADQLRREREPKKGKGWSRSKLLGVVFFASLVLVVGVYAIWQNTQPASNNRQLAPLFTLADLDGNTIALENLTGKVVVLDFFFVQCMYCDDEVVHLEEIHREYSRNEVEIISISIHENTVEDLREYRKGPNRFSDLEYEMSWIVARDTAGVIEQYDVQGYPTTIIIDQKGFISPHSPYRVLTDASTLMSEIDYLLSNP